MMLNPVNSDINMSEELKSQAQAASVVTTAESAYLEEIKKNNKRNGKIKRKELTQRLHLI